LSFEHETDARLFWDAMRERLKEFALSLHPEKTRLIEFGSHAADRRAPIISLMRPSAAKHFKTASQPRRPFSAIYFLRSQEWHEVRLGSDSTAPTTSSARVRAAGAPE
jgi:hypothetical protein